MKWIFSLSIISLTASSQDGDSNAINLRSCPDRILNLLETGKINYQAEWGMVTRRTP